MPPAQRRTARAAAPVEAPEPPPRAMRPAAARARAAQQARGEMRATTSAYGQETEQTEVVATRIFPPGVEPAYVKVAVGKTISLGAGSYEFLRIDVSVTMPCLPEERQSVVEDAAEFVAENLLREEQSWLGSTPVKPKATRR